MGGAGNDYLQGDAGNNLVVGGDGNDTLVGSQNGSGILDGGSGDDLFRVSNFGYDIKGGDGSDTLDLTTLPAWTSNGIESGVLALLGQKGTIYNSGPQLLVSGVEKIIGTSYSDTFEVNGNVDYALVGGQGDDKFNFFSSRGKAEGGEGDDTYLIRFGVNGEHQVKYTQGDDTLVFGYDPNSTRNYSFDKIGADLIVGAVKTTKYELKDIFGQVTKTWTETLTEKVTVEGGATAFEKGLFKIGELSPTTSAIDIITTAPTAVAPKLNAGGSVDMVGSYMNDKLLVADALTLAPRAPLLVMTGNGGADTFTLEATGRHIVVTDFNVAEGDKIVFGKSTGIKDVWQLQSNGWFDDGGFHIIVETPGLGRTEYCFTGIDFAEASKAYNDGLLIF